MTSSNCGDIPHFNIIYRVFDKYRANSHGLVEKVIACKKNTSTCTIFFLPLTDVAPNYPVYYMAFECNYIYETVLEFLS